jgi:methyl-accepting chemotaxis protein
MVRCEKGAGRALLWGIFTLCVVVAIAFPVFCQGQKTDVTLTDSDKAGIREFCRIADGAANCLNVYMDARVTEMLVCSKLSERLREALTNPEARADANKTLEEWLKTSGAFEAFLLLDKTGVCLASEPAGLVNAVFSHDPAFQGAMSGKLTFIDFHKSDVLTSLDSKSKGWTVTIAVPMKVGNRLEGVLMSFLKWSRLSELVRGVQVGKTGYVWVVNSKTQVIIHPNEHLCGESVRGTKIKLPALDEALKNKAPYLTYEFENVMTRRLDTKLVGFAYPAGYGNFPGLGWSVGAGADRAEIPREPSVLEKFLRPLLEKWLQ